MPGHLPLPSFPSALDPWWARPLPSGASRNHKSNPLSGAIRLLLLNLSRLTVSSTPTDYGLKAGWSDLRPCPRPPRNPSVQPFACPVNSITCWKVERSVQLIVKEMSPGMKLIRSAVALEYQSAGFAPSVADSCIAAA